MPRQMYGLGSLVKSIGKTVKKVVKSPIGKAAILGFTGAGLMGLGPLSGLGGLGAKMGSLFSGGGAGLASMFTKAKNLYTGLSGAQKLIGAGSLGLAALAGAPEEVQMESQRDVGALRQYLSSYYKNLGYSADQIAQNVARDTSEYTSGQGGYAMGGRVNYQSGTPKQEIVKPSDSMMVDTTTSNPMPKEKSLKENLDFVKETKGGVSPSTTMYMFKMYLDEALKKGQITKEKYNKMLMPFFGETGEGVTRDFKRYEQNMAYGGRINRAYGSDDLVEQASGIEGLDININPKGVKELDLRETGGFIPPVGVKEKADDIPAMLSNNEFVFTADAVRAAGGGSVNKGAQVMYDAMKKLENGGTV